MTIVIITLLLISSSYKLSEAFMISCTILPGVLLAEYLKKDISKTNTRDCIIGIISLAFSVLGIIYLGIFASQWYLRKFENPEPILINPLFLIIIVSVFIVLNDYLWRKVAYRSTPNIMTENTNEICFISERKKVRIKLYNIAYIESNDDEVWVNTADNQQFRTKMKISRWAEILDDRFIRIHRSYIINSQHITERTSTNVTINGKHLDISRKYRQN